MNYEFERESGFINSQPSLAECLTSFPPVADSFQSSSIKSSTLSRPTLIPPPFEQTIPSLNPGSHPRHGRPRHSPDGCSPLPTASLPPEYPWMREKKASKRNHLANSTAAAISNGPVCFSPKGEWSKKKHIRSFKNGFISWYYTRKHNWGLSYKDRTFLLMDICLLVCYSCVGGENGKKFG